MYRILCISIVWMTLLGPIVPASAFAQDVTKDLPKINQAYADHSSFGADLTYSLYPSHTSSRSFQQLRGKVQNQGNSQYSKMDMVETLMNEKYALMVNHELHSMSIQAAISRTAQVPQVDVDSLYNYCQEVKFIQLDDKRVGYDFFFADSENERIRLVFDPKTYVIKKIIFYQREAVALTEGEDATPVRIEIVFQNIQINQKFPANTFSESRFVQKIAGDFQPAAPFAAYQLVNFLSDQP